MARVKRAFSPKEILKMKRYPLKLQGRWKDAFGEPEESETWFISGPSASGKSSFVMQLAKMLCDYGRVLYVSLEEGTNLSFQRRLAQFRMDEVQGKFRVIDDNDMDALRKRLKRNKSPKFIIIDSVQYTPWLYPEIKQFISEEFPRKCFIFISQENKGRPTGNTAVRLKYDAGVKIRTWGFEAKCLGRYVGEDEAAFDIWPERQIKINNDIK